MALPGITEDSEITYFKRGVYSALTKHDLCDLLEILNQCLKIGTPTELKELLLRIRNIIPCINIIAVLDRMDPSGRFQDLMKTVNSETHQQAKTLYEKDLHGKAKEYRLSKRVPMGVPSPRHNSGSLFSFAGESIGEHGRHAVLLENLVLHLHLAFLRVAFSRPAKTAVLSVREQEVLKWMKEGKTNWEISHILSISERTVKFHVQNILAKLRASTRGHAIALAMEQRLIGL